MLIIQIAIGLFLGFVLIYNYEYVFLVLGWMISAVLIVAFYGSLIAGLLLIGYGYKEGNTGDMQFGALVGAPSAAIIIIYHAFFRSRD